MDHTVEQAQVVNKLTEIIAATSLKPYQTVNRCTANTATDSYTVTLPPVASCAGQMFTFHATIANSKTITIAHKGDSNAWSNLAFTATGDFAIMYSDGTRWYVLMETTT